MHLKANLRQIVQVGVQIGDIHIQKPLFQNCSLDSHYAAAGCGVNDSCRF